MGDLPFTPLEVDNAVQPLKPMSSTVDPPNTCNGISFRAPCVCLTDRVERGTAGVDLMEESACQGPITIQFKLLPSLVNPLVEH